MAQPSVRRDAMSEPLDRIYRRLLVLRCQTGDAAAFAELVARFQDRLRRYVRTLVDDAGAVDDVLQDAWLDVWRGIGRLRDTEALEAWLFRIARDRTWRMLRRRRTTVAIEPIDQVDLADHADAELAGDERELVAKSIDRLPLEQREVLLLRFVEELSYQQIATAMGCELGTVRSRLHYAKLALRQRLAKEQP
jgi:RNA polymerase sigma-70 factor (ECF subfamily)